MGVSGLSSLRIESLRLVWLEAFLEVTDKENVSAAARAMGVDQSTISRYMIALEEWAGRGPLLRLPTKEEQEGDDEQDVRFSRMTEAGADLFQIIHEFVPRLANFRNETPRRKRLMKSMDTMTSEMMADLNSEKPSQAAQSLEEAIVRETENFVSLGDGLAPMELVETRNVALRRVYAKYENQLKKEQRVARRKTTGRSGANIDMSAYRKASRED